MSYSTAYSCYDLSTCIQAAICRVAIYRTWDCAVLALTDALPLHQLTATYCDLERTHDAGSGTGIRLQSSTTAFMACARLCPLSSWLSKGRESSLNRRREKHKTRRESNEKESMLVAAEDPSLIPVSPPPPHPQRSQCRMHLTAPRPPPPDVQDSITLEWPACWPRHRVRWAGSQTVRRGAAHGHDGMARPLRAVRAQCCTLRTCTTRGFLPHVWCTTIHIQRRLHAWHGHPPPQVQGPAVVAEAEMGLVAAEVAAAPEEAAGAKATAAL